MRRAFFLVPLLLLVPAIASAQPRPLPQGQQVQPQVVVQQDITLPPPPVVDDPDLKPLPPAKRSVASWDEITSYLRARSADLRIALDEVGRAEAQRRVAYAAVLGLINANGAYTHNFITATTQPGVDTGTGQPCTPGSTPTCVAFGNAITSPAPDLASGSITASLAIIAPRAWNAIHTAGVNIDIAKSSVDDIKRNIATNVANAALTVVTNEHVAELNRVGLRQALERLELAKRKTGLGAGTGLDVVRAKQDVENARSTLVSGDEAARQAREAFGLSLGVADDVSVAGDLSFDAITRQVLSQCKTADIDQRPDIIVARERIHAAHLLVWDVWTQFIPTVSLASTLSTTTIQSNPQTLWNVQALITWNIWDGGARYGNLRDTRLQETEARERFDSARRAGVIQVVQADRGVQVAQTTREVSSRSRDLAAEVDRLTRAGFITGQGTSLDLVTAAAALRQAEINLALADFGLVKAKILAVLSLATCPL